MPSVTGALRRALLAPTLAEVSFAGRGFPVAPSAATERLEAAPQAVVCGFEWGIGARDLWDIHRRLTMVEPELRGFAVEGATMAFAIRDAVRGRRNRHLMLGVGHPHIFLGYTGIGFAMARLPRRLWGRLLPDLTGSPYYPTMSWLVVDGYGFDRAYFDTKRWVGEQRRPRPYPWQGSADYFPRAVDQGIGRALWFIHGAGADGVARAVRAFAEDRQPDLWSGVGLAAAFAGGCTPSGFAALNEAAGVHWSELALGVVLAAKARTFAGYVPAHTEVAADVIVGLTAEDAAQIADQTEVEPPAPGVPEGPVPQYEVWRQRIRDCLSKL
ncbi:MAG TPA: DUF1702 family protein [Actinocrinis sp.]|nr:DUF1702 family protein [Actinocrinis sp.]